MADDVGLDATAATETESGERQREPDTLVAATKRRPEAAELAPTVTPDGAPVSASAYAVTVRESGDDAVDPSELIRTLPRSARPSSRPGPVDPGDSLRPDAGGFDRYGKRSTLGEGGMGVVRLMRDDVVGRDVAMKVMQEGHGSYADLRARFLREARVQGQLEHPAVVPVYDIGTTPEGETYFTMKRVKGHTLESIIEERELGEDPGPSRRQLLSAFSSVCLAVAFAHSRGVVHRDLKPANLMHGDFGEVYVLDWGVAKVAGDADDPVTDGVDSGGARGLQTRAGALLGTPGYMSPEQARGANDEIGPASDIYSLGAILYELLTGQRLHRGGTAEALLSSTMLLEAAHPAEVDPEVPPELDAVCAKATARDPGARFADARELSAAIEGYLDGQRDTERRRELAESHAHNARVELELATAGGDDAEQHRAEAMRQLNAAIGLDPSNEAAVSSLVQVLVSSGDELPAEAERELKEVNRQDRTRMAGASALVYASWWLAAPFLLWMGIRNWGVVAAMEGVGAFLIAFAVWMWRTGNATPRYMRFALPVGLLVVSMLSFIMGPLILVPAGVMASTSAFSVGLRANRLTRMYLISLGMAAVLVPFGLQLAGVLPPSYAFEGGKMVVLPLLTGLPKLPTLLFLVSSSLLTILAGNLMVGLAVKRVTAAERRAFGQAWRLRQLLPESARAASAAATEAPSTCGG